MLSNKKVNINLRHTQRDLTLAILQTIGGNFKMSLSRPFHFHFENLHWSKLVNYRIDRDIYSVKKNIGEGSHIIYVFVAFNVIKNHTIY